MISDYELQSYNFDLPEELIASFPPAKRGDSRLLVLNRNTARNFRDAMFMDLPAVLPEGALLVANNSRVLPARLYGRRKSGGRVELLLLTPLPLILHASGNFQDSWQCSEAECLLRSGGRIQPGENLDFGDNLWIEVLKKEQFGKHRINLHWQGSLEKIFGAGEIPLPPYLRRKAEPLDEDRYQTVYADATKTGSVAAPTAGLHFTAKMKDSLAAGGFGWAELTLYVGYGTFSPVRCVDIRQHVMHPEYVEISEECADQVREAMKVERPVVAVGTTSIRALEGVAATRGEICPYSGWLNIFIYPGKKFKVARGLLTNFHLPGSTLLMLVSAFAGRENILAAYRHAVEKQYRFFSYGDAMLIV